MDSVTHVVRRIFQLLLVASVLLVSPAWGDPGTGKTGKGILWEVKSGASTAYLFGSIHFAKADFYPLSSSVEQAFRSAGTLLVEVDMTDPAVAEKTMPFLTYTPPDSLKRHVSEKTWHHFESTFGPAAAQLQSIRPAALVAALAIQVASTLGYDPQEGIDLYFTKRAKASAKKVLELESVEFQARILGSLNDSDGNAMLEELLSELRNGALARELANMGEAWRSGDAAALARVLQEAGNKDDGSRRLMKLLLDDRNVGMANKIARALDGGGTLFVVVGAAHLLGPNSIVDILQKQGLQVQRIDVSD